MILITKYKINTFRPCSPTVKMLLFLTQITSILMSVIFQSFVKKTADK